ncbi:MAG: NAD-dependent deacylase [Rhodobacteraceae bacterium]|nr:NAD-dependent deacylase [Paracoccaceae bacterium]
MVENIVILTGAGISAESGLGTFRDAGGLWEQYPLEQVATPEGFARNPALVHDFYNARRKNCAEAEPNPAHFALADLERNFKGSVLIVTQNVDDLHERAGSQNILHMHGEMGKAKCHICDYHWHSPPELFAKTPCPSCTKPATRPDIVWFGEMPYHMVKIELYLQDADLFVSIGTSGNVYPAAGFVQQARLAGAQTLELNLEPSQGASNFHAARNGPASEVVPQWVGEIIRAGL